MIVRTAGLPEDLDLLGGDDEITITGAEGQPGIPGGVTLSKSGTGTSTITIAGGPGPSPTLAGGNGVDGAVRIGQAAGLSMITVHAAQESSVDGVTGTIEGGTTPGSTVTVTSDFPAVFEGTVTGDTITNCEAAPSP